MKLFLDSYKQPGGDWNSALAACLRDVPTTDWTGRDSTRPAVGAMILLTGTAQPYSFREFVLPKNKIFSMWAPSRSGSVIQTTSGSCAFIIEKGWSSKTFYGLMFDSCGIAFEDNARGFYAFNECSFDHAPDWAVRALGPSVVGPAFYDCEFNRCFGGIYVPYAYCDNWIIRDTKFKRQGAKPSVVSGTSGIHLDMCMFENRSSPESRAYIQIIPSLGYDGGQTYVKNCRFGGEFGDGFGPPPQAILFGPDEETTGTMSGIQVQGNLFCRPLLPPGESEYALVYSAIGATKAVNTTDISGNTFGLYNGPLVRIYNAQNKFAITNMHSNYWRNTRDERFQAAVLGADRWDGAYGRLDRDAPFRMAA